MIRETVRKQTKHENELIASKTTKPIAMLIQSKETWRRIPKCVHVKTDTTKMSKDTGSKTPGEHHGTELESAVLEVVSFALATDWFSLPI